MPNETLNQTHTKIEELRAQNEMMDLAIDLAFKERLHALLKNPNSDPELLFSYLQMHEKRRAQKLKEFMAKLKEREIIQNEELAERRLALAERKQTLNELKFQNKTQDLPDKNKAPAPKIHTAGDRVQSLAAGPLVKPAAPPSRTETIAPQVK